MSANSLQGIQNQILAFLDFTLHSRLVQLIMPRFLESRLQYELMDRPSRAYSWVVFILSSVISEIPSQSALAVIQFCYLLLSCEDVREWVGDKCLSRTKWPNVYADLILSSFLIDLSADGCKYHARYGYRHQNLCLAVFAVPHLLRVSILSHNLTSSVLVAPTALPRFWIFMYRATPITYFVNAVVSAGIAGVEVGCSDKEVVRFDPREGQTCASCLQAHIAEFGGRLLNIKRHNNVRSAQFQLPMKSLHEVEFRTTTNEEI